MHLWRRLGITQVNLVSALALHKRSYKQMRFYFDDNLDNFGQHYIRCCVLMLTTTETTFLGNLQLPFCVRGGVYNTPRCLCCLHIKRKVVKFGVVSCCLCCRLNFYSFAKLFI